VGRSSSLPTSTTRAWSPTRPFACRDAVSPAWVRNRARIGVLEAVGELLELVGNRRRRLRRARSGFIDLVCAAHRIQHGLALPIGKARKQLLCIAKHKRPGKNLRRAVQRVQARHELAPHKQQPKESGERAHWQFEDGEQNG
jgi:hypothetical protein